MSNFFITWMLSLMLLWMVLGFWYLHRLIIITNEHIDEVTAELKQLIRRTNGYGKPMEALAPAGSEPKETK